MRAATQHLSPIALELGGKAFVPVDESAPIVDTAKKLLWEKFLNAA